MEEKVLQKMSVQQFKSAKALIKEACSNYDTSTDSCLLLDRGEAIPCPQMISQSLCCKFFRDVLLEDKRGRELKDDIMGKRRVVCASCGGHFRAVSNRAKYCTRCAKEHQREKAKERKRKQRLNVTL